MIQKKDPFPDTTLVRVTLLEQEGEEEAPSTSCMFVTLKVPFPLDPVFLLTKEIVTAAVVELPVNVLV